MLFIVLAVEFLQQSQLVNSDAEPKTRGFLGD